MKAEQGGKGLKVEDDCNMLKEMDFRINEWAKKREMWVQVTGARTVIADIE